MNIKITGKDLKATESINDYIERKMERIEKYLNESTRMLQRYLFNRYNLEKYWRIFI